MRSLLFILCFLPLGVFAQQVKPNDLAENNNRPDVLVLPDTPPQSIKQGVIRVRKPQIRPYFKCEYYLTMSRVHEVEVMVETPFGLEKDKMPVFDSSYGRSLERVYPQKEIHFSRQLVDTIQYSYSFEDTASIDTMAVQMWIGTNGKVRWVQADTVYTGGMQPELKKEIYRYAISISDWGKGGGYSTPKKFMRRQKRAAESYYCLLYIIVSAKPLTAEQRHTGMRWAPFDIPLNSPPENEQQKDFLNGNKYPYKDDVKKQ